MNLCTFNAELEIKKIKSIFRAIRNDWLNRNRKDFSVEFRHFEDSESTGEAVDDYMNSLLFGNHFGHFVLFSGFIESDTTLFWLTIAEDDENHSLDVSFSIYFEANKKDEIIESPLMEGSIELKDVREKIWEIYNFFEGDQDVALDPESRLKKIFEV